MILWIRSISAWNLSSVHLSPFNKLRNAWVPIKTIIHSFMFYGNLCIDHNGFWRCIIWCFDLQNSIRREVTCHILKTVFSFSLPNFFTNYFITNEQLSIVSTNFQSSKLIKKDLQNLFNILIESLYLPLVTTPCGKVILRKYSNFVSSSLCFASTVRVFSFALVLTVTWVIHDQIKIEIWKKSQIFEKDKVEISSH